MGLLTLSFGNIWAQKKYEREYRISSNKVPPSALQFVADIRFSKTVKWYREQGLETTTIEAKTKHKGNRYSIEFTKEGVLEDIEYLIQWNDIPASTQSKITNFLKEKHQKTKLQKIQRQYTGDRADMLRLMKGEVSDDIITIKYEIVLKARTKGAYETIEYLFSENGAVERKSVIVLKNTDNLEF